MQSVVLNLYSTLVSIICDNTVICSHVHICFLSHPLAYSISLQFLCNRRHSIQSTVWQTRVIRDNALDIGRNFNHFDDQSCDFKLSYSCMSGQHLNLPFPAIWLSIYLSSKVLYTKALYNFQKQNGWTETLHCSCCTKSNIFYENVLNQWTYDLYIYYIYLAIQHEQAVRREILISVHILDILRSKNIFLVWYSRRSVIELEFVMC